MIWPMSRWRYKSPQRNRRIACPPQTPAKKAPANAPAVMKLSAFTILIPDYDAAIAFFCAGLGFSLTEDIPQGPKRWVTVTPPGENIRLVLARADTPAQRAALQNPAGGRVWLFLQSDDFAADAAKITAAGGTFEETPRQEPYGTVAVWRDPFGNRWDLIQAAL